MWCLGSNARLQVTVTWAWSACPESCVSVIHNLPASCRLVGASSPIQSSFMAQWGIESHKLLPRPTHQVGSTFQVIVGLSHCSQIIWVLVQLFPEKSMCHGSIQTMFPEDDTCHDASRWVPSVSLQKANSSGLPWQTEPVRFWRSSFSWLFFFLSWLYAQHEV